MGCNIPRPSKRPPTPPISDQPYGSKTNEAVEALARFSRAEIEAFKQFGQVAHDLNYHDTDLDKPIKDRRTNCPNCCAAITGPICEYCGTRFPDLESHNQEIIIPVYVGGNQIDTVVKQNRTRFRSGNPAADVVAPTLPIKKIR